MIELAPDTMQGLYAVTTKVDALHCRPELLTRARQFQELFETP